MLAVSDPSALLLQTLGEACPLPVAVETPLPAVLRGLSRLVAHPSSCAGNPSTRSSEPPWDDSVDPSDTIVSVDCEWLQLSLEEEAWRLRGRQEEEEEEKRPRERTEAGLADIRLQRLRVRRLQRLRATTSTVGGKTAFGMILER